MSDKFTMPDLNLLEHMSGDGGEVCRACRCDISPPPEFAAAYLAGAIEALEFGQEGLTASLCAFHKNIFEEFAKEIGKEKKR